MWNEASCNNTIVMLNTDFMYIHKLEYYKALHWHYKQLHRYHRHPLPHFDHRIVVVVVILSRRIKE